MIDIINTLAQTVMHYDVNIDSSYIIPAAYILAFVVGLLLREFTYKWIRYGLALIFTICASLFWFILLAENSPAQYIAICATLFGLASTLWHWIRDIIKAVKD